MMKMNQLSLLRGFSLLSLLLIVPHSPIAESAQPGSGTGGPKYPVILVPGDGASQLQVKLNRKQVDHSWCAKKTDGWQTLWMNFTYLFPVNNSICLADDVRLIYNPATHTTSDPDGVSIRIPGFGNTTTIEYMDFDEKQLSEMFATMVNFLVQNLSYTRDVNVRGAPYDFRKAPAELDGYMKRVVSLIEDTYKMNKNKKVVLIAHSMGNIYTTYLLNQQTQAWKDQYIRAFMSLGGPYGGLTKMYRTSASGDNFGIPGVDPVIMREAVRSFPSNVLILPTDTYWGSNEVIVYSPSGNYTVYDYAQFFNDIEFPQGMLLVDDTKRYLKDLHPPNVEVHCLYGTGVPTEESYVYTGDVSDWFNSQPSINYGGGDGTVNLRSLLGCQEWVGEQNEAVSLTAFPSVTHNGMLMDADVLAYIAGVLND